VDRRDENIKGIQLKRMVDRIRRFQVSSPLSPNKKIEICKISWANSYTSQFNDLGAEFPNFRHPEQVFEDELQREREHAGGACPLLSSKPLE
jgi:hypothetical protein